MSLPHTFAPPSSEVIARGLEDAAKTLERLAGVTADANERQHARMLPPFLRRLAKHSPFISDVRRHGGLEYTWGEPLLIGGALDGGSSEQQRDEKTGEWYWERVPLWERYVLPGDRVYWALLLAHVLCATDDPVGGAFRDLRRGVDNEHLLVEIRPWHREDLTGVMPLLSAECIVSRRGTKDERTKGIAEQLDARFHEWTDLARKHMGLHNAPKVCLVRVSELGHAHVFAESSVDLEGRDYRTWRNACTKVIDTLSRDLFPVLLNATLLTPDGPERWMLNDPRRVAALGGNDTIGAFQDLAEVWESRILDSDGSTLDPETRRFWNTIFGDRDLC